MKFPALMQSLLDAYQSRPLAPSKLSALVRRAVGKEVILRTRRSSIVDYGAVLISGTYDQHLDQEGDKAIEINMLYHPATDELTLDEAEWFRMSFDVAECVGHEFVHKKQFRKRRWKSSAGYNGNNDEERYLGDPDEVEAYGFSIAAELVAVYGQFEPDAEALDQVFMYNVYQKTFEHDKSVMLQLDQDIVKYLCRLEVDYNAKTNPRRTTR